MIYRILTAAAVAVSLAGPALAADEIRPAGPPIVLQPSSGTLIQSPSPLGNVFVANPDIASVQVPTEGVSTKNLIYIFGKAPGKTTVFALSEDGNIVLSRTVEVPGPRTVRVLRGNHRPEIWSEVHGEPTNSGRSLDDLPPGSILSVPVGGVR